MERLTSGRGNRCEMCVVADNGKCLLNNTFPCAEYKIYAKLAAYEETGLEPEKIMALCDMDSRAKMAEMLKTEEYYGVSIDRLKELAKADSEERCIILPIKEGTSTWNIYWPLFDDEDPEIYESNFLMRDIEALGKTVFLTREEAEKALEEYNG